MLLKLVHLRTEGCACERICFKLFIDTTKESNVRHGAAEDCNSSHQEHVRCGFPGLAEDSKDEEVQRTSSFVGFVKTYLLYSQQHYQEDVKGEHE